VNLGRERCGDTRIPDDRRRPRKFFVAVVTLVIALLLWIAPNPASAISSWVWWDLDTRIPYDSISTIQQVITPLEASGNGFHFFAVSFVFKGGPNGYAGVQPNGVREDGVNNGPVVLFSLWEAVSASPGPNATCGPFSHEGSGFFCRLDLETVFTENLISVSREPDGLRWTATIQQPGKQPEIIGTITMPKEYMIFNLLNFIEYYGPVPENICIDLPGAAAKFRQPLLTTLDGKSKLIVYPIYSRKECIQGSMVDFNPGIEIFVGQGTTSVTSPPFPTPPPGGSVDFTWPRSIASTFNVQIPGVSRSTNARITINVPFNSTATTTTFKVFAVSDAASVDAGFVIVRLEAFRTSDNSRITNLTNAIEIRIPSSASSPLPAWSTDGLTWTLLPRLSSPVLPAGQPDGYFVNPDGTYSFFTRHLTMFGLLRAQAPLSLTASQNVLNIGQTATISVSGGTGTGALKYKTNDPAICSITADGLVSGSAAGTCTVTVSKFGSGSYLNVTSGELVISIVKPEIVVTRQLGITAIKISLATKYAGKFVTVEWGVEKNGRISFRAAGSIRVNSLGNATMKTKQLIPPNAIVRAKIGSKVVARR